MKIAILGGAFDPPHFGHLIVCMQIKEYLNMDEVWLMPVYSHPFHKHLSPVSDRLAMSKLVEKNWLKVSNFEATKDRTSYTIDTLQELSQQFPQHQFSWCIGSDQLQDFHKWKDWQKLITDYPIIVFPRGTAVLDLEKRTMECFRRSKSTEKITCMNYKDLVITNISSTIIRQRVKEGKSIEYLVPKEVEEYIYENKLYSV